MQNSQKILSALESGPTSFSNLKNRTGLANGVLQYHINNSEKISKNNGAVMLSKECDTCEIKSLCKDHCIRSELNKERKRDVLTLKHENFSQAEIAEKLGISRPTVNYHIRDLEDKGLLTHKGVQKKVLEVL